MLNYSESYYQLSSKVQEHSKNFNHFGSSDCLVYGDSGHSRGGRFANFQCQMFLKYGHTADIWLYRADTSYQPNESLVYDLYSS